MNVLTGIHFLLTYKCPYECNHCFVYGSPRAKGTFTLAQVVDVLEQAQKLGTVQTVFFEGGEPFLYYPHNLLPYEAAASGGGRGIRF